MGESPARRSRPDLCDALFAAPVPAAGLAAPGPEFEITELPSARAGTPVFRMEGTVAAPLRLVVAMIREFDLGNLTGNLAAAEVLESKASDPFHQRLFYVSKLPWPFRARAFHIGNWAERPTAESFAMLSISLAPDDAVRARVRKEVWGEVVFSGYFLVPLANQRTWLRRVIGVELQLPMPRGVLRRMLIEVYRGNYKWLNAAPGQSDLFRRYEERMAKDPIYGTLPAARA